MMWSIGALMELPDRALLEQHMRETYTSLDYPSCIDNDDSMFEYLVDESGKLFLTLLSFV